MWFPKYYGRGNDLEEITIFSPCSCEGERIGVSHEKITCKTGAFGACWEF